MGASRESGTPEPALVGPLTAFAAAMAVGDSAAASRALQGARRAGARRVMLEETALMLMLHAGYPAALEGLRVLNQVWPGRARHTRIRRVPGGPADWMRRGEALATRVYGPSMARLRRNVAALHPDLDVWMIEQGYGRVLSRPGLSYALRELVAVTVLAATGWERQLVSHLLGAARMGARPVAIRAAFQAGAQRARGAGRAACRRAWRAALAATPVSRAAARRTPRRG